jgi:hypothetical protein
MATQKSLQPDSINEESDASLVDEAYSEDDYPSSSPKKKQLTARALLESGIVGMWKDRTDIGDTLDFARKLRERADTRWHE